MELTNEEILKLINKALNIETVEEKEAKRRARVRKVKADFFNLKDMDTCKFVEA